MGRDSDELVEELLEQWRAEIERLSALIASSAPEAKHELEARLRSLTERIETIEALQKQLRAATESTADLADSMEEAKAIFQAIFRGKRGQ